MDTVNFSKLLNLVSNSVEFSCSKNEFGELIVFCETCKKLGIGWRRIISESIAAASILPPILLLHGELTQHTFLHEKITQAIINEMEGKQSKKEIKPLSKIHQNCRCKIEIEPKFKGRLIELE